MAADVIFLVLGVLASLIVLCTIIACAAETAKEEGGGGSRVSSKQEALLNKNKDAVAAPQQPAGASETSDGGDVDMCAICMARLADTSWARCRRLRACGHVYHADCISLWLKRKRICPVCRAGVALLWTEILNAIV